MDAEHDLVIERVVRLTNLERAAAGCDALRLDPRLAAAAEQHSSDMAARGYFAHTSPEGVTFAEQSERAGYDEPGGQNIAQGQDSAREVVQAWMDSPSHRENILNCEFTTIGVGFDPHGRYWTQNFGY